MRYFIIIAFVFVAGCKPDSPGTVLDESAIIVAGVLEAGENPGPLQFAVLPDEPGDLEHRDMTLTSEGGSQMILHYESGYYRGDESDTLQPGENYRLQVEYSGHEITAYCPMPPAISLNQVNQTTISIGDGSTIPIILNWTGLDEDRYSYVLRLDNLEEEKVEIPFDGGHFAERFSGPQVESAAFLVKTDFKYYGHHQLKVFAIDRDFESVFFFDPADLRGLLKNGPDNIQGAKGYISGVTSFVVDLYVEE